MARYVHFRRESVPYVYLGHSEDQIASTGQHFFPSMRSPTEKISDITFSLAGPLNLAKAVVTIEPVKGIRFDVNANVYDFFKDIVREMRPRGELQMLSVGPEHFLQPYLYHRSSLVDNVPKVGDFVQRMKKTRENTWVKIYMPEEVADALKKYDFAQNDEVVRNLEDDRELAILDLRLVGKLADRKDHAKEILLN